MHRIAIDSGTGQAQTIPITTLEVAAIKSAEIAAAEHTRSRLISFIKAEAGHRIELTCPGWRQHSLNARAAQLALQERSTWTAEEMAELEAIRTTWAAIDAIRQRSNHLEAVVAGLGGEALSSFDPRDELIWQDAQSIAGRLPFTVPGRNKETPMPPFPINPGHKPVKNPKPPVPAQG